MSVHTFLAKKLLSELEEDKDRYLANREAATDKTSRCIHTGMAAALTVVLEKLRADLPGIEDEAAELDREATPSGWDDGSAVEYNRSDWQTLHDAGRA